MPTVHTPQYKAVFASHPPKVLPTDSYRHLKINKEKTKVKVTIC